MKSPIIADRAVLLESVIPSAHKGKLATFFGHHFALKEKC